MAAFEVLYTNAASFAKDSAQGECGVMAPVVLRAMARAEKAPQALDASLELDLGIAAAMSAAMTGRMPANGSAAKLVDVTESVEYGEDCPDVFKISRRLAGPSGTLGARVAEVLADLRGSPRCMRLRKMLEAAAPPQLAHAVDSLRLDEADDVTNTDNPLSRCPELPLVMERISAAIAAGAPIYNKGDVESCRKLYEDTTRALLDQTIPAGRCPGVRAELGTAVADAGRATTPAAAAWSLRRGFDRIGNAVGGTDNK